MSKIYNNIEHGAAQPQPMDGWFETNPYDANRIKHICDTIGGGNAVTKMGTSIPTPFARLVLFNTAFEQLRTQDDNSVYGRLVSECLDMIEFVYNFGNDITLKKWNIANEIAALKTSNDTKHKDLGKSLEVFAHELGVSDIFLIYYQGELVGGTSPYTLLYTSPNWVRNNRYDLQGLAGNRLFPDYANRNVQPTPLYKRDPQFQEFLTDYIVAYRDALQRNNSNLVQNNALWRYVYDNAQTGASPQMQAYYAQITGNQILTPDDFMQKYASISDDMGVQIDIKGLGLNLVLPLAFCGVGNMGGGDQGGNQGGQATVLPDDYQLQPISNRWVALHPDLKANQVPLVLNEGGVTGAAYIGNNPWKPGTPINNDPTMALSQRVLPGAGNITYPYLTAEDFLEDQIICVDYQLNDQAFTTFGLGSYLPPLKPTFFEYFDIRDLELQRNVKIAVQEDPKGNVTVELTLPIHHGSIVLKKVYTDTQVVRTKLNRSFCLAVFPSYKLVGANNVPNRFSVMRYDEIESPSLELTYWKVSDHLAPLPETMVSNTQRGEFGMSYDAVDTDFDFIQVRWKGAKALLVPHFSEVNPKNSGANVVVGIDFGTTNTYVCLSTQNGANPQPVEFSAAEPQTLMLSSDERLITFNSAAEREFAPEVMGERCMASYPFRTVIYENTDTLANPQRALHDFKLFADGNVGFKFINEEMGVKELNGEYVSSIKWDMEKTRDANELNIMQNRVEAFCRQTAWMLKNRIMADPKTACPQFTAKLTFPYTMLRPTIRRIMDSWRNAFDYVMGPNNVSIEDITESVAPYYYMIGNGVTFNGNVLNVDVGGGTTDILYADVKNEHLFYDSSHFAGNDIWGNAPQIVVGQPQAPNGFIRLFEQMLENGAYPDDDVRGYNTFKGLVKDPADCISYVFSHNNVFNFIERIGVNPKLMAVLHLHLGALCSHIAHVLVKEQMELPLVICFSGQGSKYIKIISNRDTDITELVKLYIEAFLPDGLKLSNRFKVMFQKNSKEVTAQGAMLNANASLASINEFARNSITVSGLEDCEPETYKDAASDEVMEKARKAYEDFKEKFLLNNKVRNYLKNNYEIDFTDEFITTFSEAFEDGYSVMAGKVADPSNTLTESVFFWPFKLALYRCSCL